MLFKVDNESKKLKPVTDFWQISELELEKYILTSQDTDVQTLNHSIFNEELLIISNQVRTKSKKRADILALDKMGNAVIVELKRDQGNLGVETQALQYLADFSNYRGKNFLDHFVKEEDIENVISFIGGDQAIESINENSRILLIANGFDSTLFSMGEWLFSKGVGFRCVSYAPVLVENCKLISFSLAFDRSLENLYPLNFSSIGRRPKIFWHNVGFNEHEWLTYLYEKETITANFDCEIDDPGYKLLRSYIAGDRLIAYVTGFGAVGYGEITKHPQTTYELVKEQSPEDIRNGSHLHRIHITWKAFTTEAENAIKTSEIRNTLGIYHPVSTSTGMDQDKGEQLVNMLKNKFVTENS